MALSDYAYIAFDKEGKPTQENAQFGRITIEPYNYTNSVGIFTLKPVKKARREQQSGQQ